MARDNTHADATHTLCSAISPHFQKTGHIRTHTFHAKPHPLTHRHAGSMISMAHSSLTLVLVPTPRVRSRVSRQVRDASSGAHPWRRDSTRCCCSAPLMNLAGFLATPATATATRHEMPLNPSSSASFLLSSLRRSLVASLRKASPAAAAALSPMASASTVAAENGAAKAAAEKQQQQPVQVNSRSPPTGSLIAISLSLSPSVVLRFLWLRFYWECRVWLRLRTLGCVALWLVVLPGSVDQDNLGVVEMIVEVRFGD